MRVGWGADCACAAQRMRRPPGGRWTAWLRRRRRTARGPPRTRPRAPARCRCRCASVQAPAAFALPMVQRKMFKPPFVARPLPGRLMAWPSLVGFSGCSPAVPCADGSPTFLNLLRRAAECAPGHDSDLVFRFPGMQSVLCCMRVGLRHWFQKKSPGFAVDIGDS